MAVQTSGGADACESRERFLSEDFQSHDTHHIRFLISSLLIIACCQ